MATRKAGPQPGGIRLKHNVREVPTVAQYFARMLGAPLPPDVIRDPAHGSSPAHAGFTIRTGCGVECAAAIDAAAELIKHVRVAHAEYGDDDVRKIIEITAHVVSVYVYG